ncbi:MAG: hypothetical protein MR009_04185 [Sutterellaceae bacterium]|nr:hypothetical protein [Sutterellaceae bacterium]MDD7442349.1 hypothetical protein [Sutterellaceae bacterium]MDY2868994.1 hypothetical protein [Mesosutterella sp.]
MKEALAKYVRSYVPGRIRVRHPALRDEEKARAAAKFLMELEGAVSVVPNPRVGSLLFTYDPEKITLGTLEGMASFCLPPEAPARNARAEKNAFERLDPLHAPKTVNRNVNRAMTAAFALVLLGLVPGTFPGKRLALHTAAGSAFTALLAWHLARYRRTLL